MASDRSSCLTGLVADMASDRSSCWTCLGGDGSLGSPFSFSLATVSVDNKGSCWSAIAGFTSSNLASLLVLSGTSVLLVSLTTSPAGNSSLVGTTSLTFTGAGDSDTNTAELGTALAASTFLTGSSSLCSGSLLLVLGFSSSFSTCCGFGGSAFGVSWITGVGWLDSTCSSLSFSSLHVASSNFTVSLSTCGSVPGARAVAGVSLSVIWLLVSLVWILCALSSSKLFSGTPSALTTDSSDSSVVAGIAMCAGGEMSSTCTSLLSASSLSGFSGWRDTGCTSTCDSLGGISICSLSLLVACVTGMLIGTAVLSSSLGGTFSLFSPICVSKDSSGLVIKGALGTAGIGIGKSASFWFSPTFWLAILVTSLLPFFTSVSWDSCSFPSSTTGVVWLTDWSTFWRNSSLNFWSDSETVGCAMLVVGTLPSKDFGCWADNSMSYLGFEMMASFFVETPSSLLFGSVIMAFGGGGLNATAVVVTGPWTLIAPGVFISWTIRLKSCATLPVMWPVGGAVKVAVTLDVTCELIDEAGSGCITAGGCASGLLSPILTSFLVFGSIILIAFDCRLGCGAEGRGAVIDIPL